MKMTACMIIRSTDALSQNRFVWDSKKILRMNPVCHVDGINKLLYHFIRAANKNKSLSFLDYKSEFTNVHLFTQSERNNN